MPNQSTTKTYPGSGFINQNTKKNKETQPDIVGTVDFECPPDAVPGKVYRMRLAGWTKTGDRGVYYSIKVSQEQDKPAGAAASQPYGSNGVTGTESEEIPF